LKSHEDGYISFVHSPTRSRDVSADRTARLYWWLPERSSRRIRSSPQSIPSYHGPHRNHPGMDNRLVEAAVLRRQSHPIITNLPVSWKLS
jgi:hypothetical protein